MTAHADGALLPLGLCFDERLGGSTEGEFLTKIIANSYGRVI